MKKRKFTLKYPPPQSTAEAHAEIKKMTSRAKKKKNILRELTSLTVSQQLLVSAAALALFL